MCLPIGETDEVGDAEKNKRIEDDGEGNKVEMHCVFVCCVYACLCVFRDLLSPSLSPFFDLTSLTDDFMKLSYRNVTDDFITT